MNAIIINMKIIFMNIVSSLYEAYKLNWYIIHLVYVDMSDYN